MTFVDSAGIDDERGTILTTYSGSLVALGPGRVRHLQYASIKMRSDVPDIVRCSGVRLDAPLNVGDIASFADSKVKHTSSVYRIAVTPGDLAPEDQEQRVREAMVFLTNSFVHMNRHFTYPGGGAPGQFDKKSMIRFLAESNDLTQKTVRNLLDDYAVLLETGMLMGNTVPLGQLGRLSLTLKPSRKARLGRNPANGEEMMIPARDALMSPVFRFSSRAKERSANLPVTSDSDGED
jgi:nucleoid DNA-binding protein